MYRLVCCVDESPEKDKFKKSGRTLSLILVCDMQEDYYELLHSISEDQLVIGLRLVEDFFKFFIEDKLHLCHKEFLRGKNRSILIFPNKEEDFVCYSLDPLDIDREYDIYLKAVWLLDRKANSVGNHNLRLRFEDRQSTKESDFAARASGSSLRITRPKCVFLSCLRPGNRFCCSFFVSF